MEYQEIDGIKGDLYHIYQEIENQPVFLYSFYVDNETGNIYAVVKDGLLTVYPLAYFNNNAMDNNWVTSQEAMDLIETECQPGQSHTKMIYVDTGFKRINGLDCYTFAYGEDTVDKFTALRYFAVDIQGTAVFEMDVSTGDYLPV